MVSPEWSAMVPRMIWLAGRIVICLLVVQTILAPIVSADCYSHDGILARNSKYYTGPELLSCGNGTNNCCLEVERCGTNLLCVNQESGVVSRQYCADANWQGCSTLCSSNVAAGLALNDCGNNVFCCGSEDPQCCSEGLGYFVDPGTGEAKARDEADSTASPTWWKVDSSAILARTGSTIDSISQTSSRTSFTFATFSTTTGSTTLANVPASTNLPIPSSSPVLSQRLSVSAAVGIGVGSTLGAASIAALVWLLARERKKQRALQAQLLQTPGRPYRIREEGHTMTELEGQQHTHELDGWAKQELDGWTNQELDGWTRQELDG